MKFDKLGMLGMVPVGVMAFIGIAVLVGPVMAADNCNWECPQDFNLICAYNAAKNCYRAFENECAMEVVNCRRPRTYVKAPMDDCGDPALWCVSKNVID